MTTAPSSQLNGDWQQRLALIVETMRDMSRHTDPQEMVRAYGERMRQLIPIGRRISLSRRGLAYPKYRITRSTTWAEDIDPWKNKDRLPLLEGGLLAELIYGNEPQVFDDLHLPGDDPRPFTWQANGRYWRSPCTTRANRSTWSS